MVEDDEDEQRDDGKRVKVLVAKSMLASVFWYAAALIVSGPK